MLSAFMSVLSAYSIISSKPALIPSGRVFSAQKVVSEHTLSLNDRYPIKSVSDIFEDNILLSLHYLNGETYNPGTINWDQIKKPFNYQFTLDPGQSFAFHDNVFSDYQNKIFKTTNSHFNYQEGYKSDGLWYGDGVCHLASLMNWVASDANLKVEAPSKHDFAPIADVPRQYGTAILSIPGQTWSNANQNLYITNTQNVPVTFKFEYQGDQLKLSVLE